MLFSNLSGGIFGGVASFILCKLSDTPFYIMVKGLKCSVSHLPNDDIHTIPFSQKTSVSGRCGIFVSFLWRVVGVVCKTRRGEQRFVCRSYEQVEPIRVRCNNVRIRRSRLSLPAKV